jgi:hypothetical protein
VEDCVIWSLYIPSIYGVECVCVADSTRFICSSCEVETVSWKHRTCWCVLDICNDNCNMSVRVNSGYRLVKCGYENVLTGWLRNGCLLLYVRKLYWWLRYEWKVRCFCSCECSIVVFENYGIENNVWCHSMSIVCLIVVLCFSVYVKLFHSV